MTYISVHCFNCGAVYHLYFDGAPQQKCPHCMASIPDKAFHKLENALFCLREVNKDLRTAHDEQGKPLFQVEIRNHYVPKEKFDL